MCFLVFGRQTSSEETPPGELGLGPLTPARTTPRRARIRRAVGPSSTPRSLSIKYFDTLMAPIAFNGPSVNDTALSLGESRSRISSSCSNREYRVRTKTGMRVSTISAIVLVPIAERFDQAIHDEELFIYLFYYLYN